MDKISVVTPVKNEAEKIVLRQLGGFKFRIFLLASLFKFLMVNYQRLTGNIQFTMGEVDSLTAREIFPDHPWREEFDIEATSFEVGVKRMLNHSDRV